MKRLNPKMQEKMKEALAAVKDDIALFARSEGLEAHARAALKRYEGE